MSGDAMDDVLSIYRRTARETPTPRVDVRILRAADRMATMRRVSRRTLWSLAAAAVLLAWIAASGSSHGTDTVPTMDAGLDAGRTRAELLRMDVTPPPSDVGRFLMNVTPMNPTPDTRNAP